MAVAHIALGANLPFAGRSPEANINLAVKAIAKFCADEAPLLSPLYRSVAWPDPNDPPYVNAVMRVKTSFAPEALLSGLFTIEAAFGRIRNQSSKNGPRALDLDLINLGNESRNGEGAYGLVLPHPAMERRLFVLMPLLDISPDWKHPKTGISAADSLKTLHLQSGEEIPIKLPS